MARSIVLLAPTLTSLLAISVEEISPDVELTSTQQNISGSSLAGTREYITCCCSASIADTVPTTNPTDTLLL